MKVVDGIRVCVLWLLTSLCFASDISKIHFLIPGGEGGGWDTTARQTGNALVKTQLIPEVSFQNLSGGGGGRAMIDLIRHPEKHNNTLMVQSTPIILRNITGVIKNNYREITPISLIIAEYQVVAVPKDSPYENIAQLLDAIEANKAANAIWGGSAKGSLDHITAALILQAASMSPRDMRYIASDGGGDALERLYNGVGVALVSGFGEVVKDFDAGKLKLLGITSEKRLHGIDVPTFIEQGLDVEFANWRGFFAKPGLNDSERKAYVALLKKLTETDHWQSVREKYGWDDFLKHGDELDQFLQTQEKSIRNTLKSLGII